MDYFRGNHPTGNISDNKEVRFSLSIEKNFGCNVSKCYECSKQANCTKEEWKRYEKYRSEVARHLKLSFPCRKSGNGRCNKDCAFYKSCSMPVRKAYEE